jgi:drug/metabolite transporter (DMT)-like permease
LVVFSFPLMKTSSENHNRLAPHIALIAVQLMFGTAPVLGKAALQTFPSYAIVGFRVGGAALAFYLLQRISGDLRLDKRSHYFYFAIYSLFGVVLNQLLFFKGLSLTTAINTSLLAVTIPVFALLISVALGNEKLTILKILGVLLAALGVINLINPANASFSSETTLGDILIILNSLSYAIYVAVSKKLISHYGALKSIAWLFLFGSLINVPVGLISLNSVELSEVSLNAWLAVLAIILFPTIGAYYWNTWALARTEPSVVAVYIYLQPLIGFIAAAIFLNEKATVWTLLSALLIFAGVFLVTRRKSNHAPSKIEF